MSLKHGKLFYHRDYDCYTCLGCGEAIEVPWRAVLRNGRDAVEVKENPENRLLWLELMEQGHDKCLALPRGFDGPRIASNPSPLAS